MTLDDSGQAGALETTPILIGSTDQADPIPYPSSDMVEAGLEALYRSGVLDIPLDSDMYLVADIYLAMANAQAHQSKAKAC